MRTSFLALVLVSMSGCTFQSTGTKPDPPASPGAPPCVVLGSTPSTLFSVPEQRPSVSFAFDGDRLYFASAATVYASDLHASCVVAESFANASDSVSGLAVAGGSLLVATDGALLQRSRTRLAAYDLVDRRPTAVGFGNFDSAGLATDGRTTFLLVREVLGFELRRFGDGDDDGAIVDSSNAAPGGVLTDGDAVYWTAGDTLYRQGKAAPPDTERFARLPGSPSVNIKSTSGILAQNDRFIFWADGNTLLRVEKKSGTTTTLTNKLEEPSSIAVDAKNVYLAEGGRLTRVSVEGGEPQTLVTEPGIVTAAVGSGFLVWSVVSTTNDPSTGTTTGGRVRVMPTPR